MSTLIGAAGERSIALATAQGREIPNSQIPDISPEKVMQYRAAFRRKFPFLRERRWPDARYNCHGLTFALRRTAIHELGVIPHILADDGFRKIRLSEVEAGDILVCYDMGEVTHTGLVIEVRVGEPSTLRRAMVLSKWGYASEYRHFADEGEYGKHELTYWTDRPNELRDSRVLVVR